MKVKAQGITQTGTRTTAHQEDQTKGNKGQEGGAYIHDRAGTQQDSGETHKGSYLMWEKDKEVKIKTIQIQRLSK